MRLLVTGGMGFIGVNFIRYMLGHEMEVEAICNIDKLTYAANPRSLDDVAGNSRYRFVQADICDAVAMKTCFQEFAPTHVVHMAAESNVDHSILDPAAFVSTNVYGTFTLLECCRKYTVCKFLYVSTDEVYGEALGSPSSIDSPLAPKSPYAASKAGGELLALGYHHTYDIPVLRTRCVNNYGCYQDPSKLIPRFIIYALTGRALPVYGTGLNTRDWIYVLDHCAFLRLLLLSPYQAGEVFNISACQERSVREVAACILEETGADAHSLISVPDRLGHVRRHAVMPSPLAQPDGTDWRPEFSFEAGMRRTVQWYRRHKAWWQWYLKNECNGGMTNVDRRHDG